MLGQNVHCSPSPPVRVEIIPIKSSLIQELEKQLKNLDKVYKEQFNVEVTRHKATQERLSRLEVEVEKVVTYKVTCLYTSYNVCCVDSESNKFGQNDS